MRTVSPESIRVLKRLCLGKILDGLPERLTLAEERGLAFEDVLLLLLTDEIGRRDGSAADRRAAKAASPPTTTKAAKDSFVTAPARPSPSNASKR